MNVVVGPIAPIIGALMGAAVAAAATYFFAAKRKGLRFWIAETEDLTSALHRHHAQIAVSIGGQGFLDLNRSTIIVENTGNASISDFKFDVEIPGQHNAYLIEVIEGDIELRKSISIKSEGPHRTYNPTLEVFVGTFLNPGECFRMGIFFDGSADTCRVKCRIADVKLKIRSGRPVSLREYFATSEIAGVFSIVIAIALLAAAFSTFEYATKSLFHLIK